MARALVIHCHSARHNRATFTSHLTSYRRYSQHECHYLNANRERVPWYIRAAHWDLVIFHDSFAKAIRGPDGARLLNLISFLDGSQAVRIVVTADESWRSIQLVNFINRAGVAHVFTFAPENARTMIYEGIDRDRVAFHEVLSGYIDERVLRRVKRLARAHPARTIDVGSRFTEWYSTGRIGQLKTRLTKDFGARARRAGFSTDLSLDPKDIFAGDDWFKLLLDCRYVLGVETGASLLDADGSVSSRISRYVSEHPDATFEQVESACFAGLDGQLDYRALAPRHLDAVLTRTCQVLVQGGYSGVLKPDLHYLEIKRDFSNADEVLEQMRDEQARMAIVERAYRDIVESGRYSYSVFAATVFSRSLPEHLATTTCGPAGQLRILVNMVDERTWRHSDAVRRRLRETRHGARLATTKATDGVTGKANVIFARVRRDLRGTLVKLAARGARLREWLRWLPGRAKVKVRPTIARIVGEERLRGVLRALRMRRG